MRLGEMPVINSEKPKEISATDIDATAFDNRLKTIEKQQMYIMIALAVVLFLTIYKSKK